MAKTEKRNCKSVRAFLRNHEAEGRPLWNGAAERRRDRRCAFLVRFVTKVELPKRVGRESMSLTRIRPPVRARPCIFQGLAGLNRFRQVYL